MNTMTLAALAEKVGGRVFGESTGWISNALPLQDAHSSSITFVDESKQLEQIDASECAAVIVREVNEDCCIPQLVAQDVRATFEACLVLLRKGSTSYELSGISPQAIVADSAQLGENVQVGPGSVIGPNTQVGDNCVIHAGVCIGPDCEIGADCTLFPKVVLYERSIVGRRVILHAGSVIGGFGFGYQTVNGQHQMTGQYGWVELGDDVEIGVNTSIDRGSYGPTKIGLGTKIDNQVQIGHNCQLGRHNMICAQVGIAGSTTTGDYVVMGGQVGVADHIRISDNVRLGAQAGIMKDVEAGSTLFGSPAVDFKQKMQEVAAVSRLLEMRKTLRILEKQVEKIQGSLDASQPKLGQSEAA